MITTLTPGVEVFIEVTTGGLHLSGTHQPLLISAGDIILTTTGGVIQAMDTIQVITMAGIIITMATGMATTTVTGMAIWMATITDTTVIIRIISTVMIITAITTIITMVQDVAVQAQAIITHLHEV